MSSIKARRKNLRMYNLDSDDIQGNYALMMRAAQQEALAPSSPTIGAVHDAICLFSFKIRDNHPNVPPIQPIKRHYHPDGARTERAARSGKWRVAAHVLIGEYSSDSVGPSGMDHSAHCLPNPFEQRTISKKEYIRMAKRFPIYVGGYLNAEGNDTVGNGLSPGFIGPGSALRVRDNDVQGGMHGTILEHIDTAHVKTQFVDGDLRGLFNGAEAGNAPRGDTIYDEDFDPSAPVYGADQGEGEIPPIRSYYTWEQITDTNGRAINNTPNDTQKENLVNLVKNIIEPLYEEPYDPDLTKGH